jgi:hypothetical protein
MINDKMQKLIELPIIPNHVDIVVIYTVGRGSPTLQSLWKNGDTPQHAIDFLEKHKKG